MLSAICSDLRNRGIEPGEILMSQDLYFWLRMDETTRLLVHGNDKGSDRNNGSDGRFACW